MLVVQKDCQKDPDVYFDRAECYCRLANPEKAIDDYTEVIKLDSNFAYDSGSIISRSLLYYDIGEYDKALEGVKTAKKPFLTNHLQLGRVILSNILSIQVLTASSRYFQESLQRFFFLRSLEILFDLEKLNLCDKTYLNEAKLCDYFLSQQPIKGELQELLFGKLRTRLE